MSDEKITETETSRVTAGIIPNQKMQCLTRSEIEIKCENGNEGLKTFKKGYE